MEILSKNWRKSTLLGESINELEINSPSKDKEAELYLNIKPKAKYFGFESFEDVENAFREIEEDIYKQNNLPLNRDYGNPLIPSYIHEEVLIKVYDAFEFKYHADYDDYKKYFTSKRFNRDNPKQHIDELEINRPGLKLPIIVNNREEWDVLAPKLERLGYMWIGMGQSNLS